MFGFLNLGKYRWLQLQDQRRNILVKHIYTVYNILCRFILVITCFLIHHSKLDFSQRRRVPFLEFTVGTPDTYLISNIQAPSKVRGDK